MPRHHLYPAPGTVGAAMFDECKRRVVAMARELPNAEVIDFSIPSPLTTTDDLWWDAVHLRPEPMERSRPSWPAPSAASRRRTTAILAAPQGLAENTTVNAGASGGVPCGAGRSIGR